MPFTSLVSEEDASANFVTKIADGAAMEARYVRRVPEYFIAYLSSHAGCDKACRFCHLTQTGQTSMIPASLADYLVQANRVLSHYDTQPPAERVNYNFMARGEPFANPAVLTKWPDIHETLRRVARHRKLTPRFNLSTIMPASMEKRRLTDFLGLDCGDVTVYYSLYSLRSSFRKRWLPKAMDPRDAFDVLASWQMNTGGQVALHWPFIAGENDDEETIDEIIELVRRRGLKVRFNLVRYNPYSAAQGEEASEEILHRNFVKLADAFGDPRSRIVPRVGFDVKASCGMFVDMEGYS